MLNPHDFRDTIFRRRFGHGRSAFGILIAVTTEIGPRERRATGTIQPLHSSGGLPFPTDCRRLSPTERIDLLHLGESPWAPTFRSRIRTRSRT